MLNGEGLASFAIKQLGVPYFYGSKMKKLTEQFMLSMHNAYPGIVTEKYMQKARDKKMVGKVCCDCSGLIGAYRNKQIGSAQLYQTASKRLKMSELSAFPVGTVLWKNGHVGVYIGNGYCVEEKGIDYGCVKTKVSSTKWSYGLLFSDIEYKDKKKVNYTSRGKNPYAEPTANIRYSARGEGVKWIQFELKEAGYDISIDGIFKNKTLECVVAFQRSCKISDDGIVGKQTREYLKAN